jgi:hypothetical protein
MRRGRIELTHELGGSSPERSSPSAAYFIWGLRSPQLKTAGQDEPNSTVEIKIQVINGNKTEPFREAESKGWRGFAVEKRRA